MVCMRQQVCFPTCCRWNLDILSFQLLGQGLQDFLNFGKKYPSKCYKSRDLGDSFAFGAYYLRCWSVQLVQTSEMDWYKQAAPTDCPNSMGHHGSMCWFHVWSSLPCWGLLIHESPSWLQLRQRQQELRGLLVSWLQESMFLFSSETCTLSSYYSTRQGSACLPPYHFIGLGKSMQNILTRTSISITVKISQDIVWLLSSLPPTSILHSLIWQEVHAGILLYTFVYWVFPIHSSHGNDFWAFHCHS